MKMVIRPRHIISLGGYIVEWDFPYRNLIIVNPTDEHIKIEVPVFNEDWIEEHRRLGLRIVPVDEDDNYLSLWMREKSKLEEILKG